MYEIKEIYKKGGNVLELNQIVDKVVEALDGKKGIDINLVDMKGCSILTDYCIVCTGTSTTHIKALADVVEKTTKELGYELRSKEGYTTAQWILLDFGDFVVNIFNESQREYYNIEALWDDSYLKNRNV